MKILLNISLLLLLSACWPSSVSFKDTGSMDERWKFFSVKTLENNAPNAPLSYQADLTEAIKSGVQNNTSLKLNSTPDDSQLNIEGAITAFDVSPIAMQMGDVAAKNRLTISVNFIIYINVERATNEKLAEDKMTLTSTRFADYDSNTDLSSVEAQLLEEINKQVVQDVINKLLSNW